MQKYETEDLNSTSTVAIEMEDENDSVNQNAEKLKPIPLLLPVSEDFTLGLQDYVQSLQTSKIRRKKRAKGHENVDDDGGYVYVNIVKKGRWVFFPICSPEMEIENEIENSEGQQSGIKDDKEGNSKSQHFKYVQKNACCLSGQLILIMRDQARSGAKYCWTSVKTFIATTRSKSRGPNPTDEMKTATDDARMKQSRYGDNDEDDHEGYKNEGNECNIDELEENCSKERAERGFTFHKGNLNVGIDNDNDDKEVSDTHIDDDTSLERSFIGLHRHASDHSDFFMSCGSESLNSFKNFLKGFENRSSSDMSSESFEPRMKYLKKACSAIDNIREKGVEESKFTPEDLAERCGVGKNIDGRYPKALEEDSQKLEL